MRQRASFTRIFIQSMAAAVLISSAGMVQAQQLKVATGGPKGTYSQMFTEIASVCQTSLNLVEQNTSGSVENIDLLVGNKINAAVVQTDVLKYRAKDESQIANNVKTLIALHPEEVHLVTRADGRKEGGFMGLGAKRVILNDFNDLQGRTVAAVGGSIITAKVLAANSGVNFSVDESYANNADALAALQESKVDAVVMVMGAPAASISQLDGAYKLLPVSGATAEKLTSIYDPVKLTYSNLSDSSGVPALSVQALFVTRDYKTNSMVSGLNALRSCVVSKIDELKETIGTHPKWQQVDPQSTGKWVAYSR
ncbi:MULTISPECIES: TAXI family TRAP transporter solute-binding subunit [Achromobacter]|uniref:TAXI family TRAP transporter solute-binding subunit n=1 Tax=Achromobacter TaxID=222 RepID=UPI0023F6AA3D|nr:TAXI family TRAP transporter solute-binding subunit [Achromobacter anxifer]MDF8362053.1 TAXI family TRAP transporter solute-binding subunit [Achromobacter anxifer]